MKDGWHTIYGYDVLVMNGCIIRGTLGEGTTYRPAYPYKHFKGYPGWHNVAGELSVSAFRYGIRNENVNMF